MITLFHMSIGNCFRMNYTESCFAESERMRQGKKQKKRNKEQNKVKEVFLYNFFNLIW